MSYTSTPRRVSSEASSSSTGGARAGPVLALLRGPRKVHQKLERPAPPWRRFNQTVGSDGSVGIWHETYIVERVNYEALCSNMPLFGLAKASEHVPAVGRRETARRRLMRDENEPAVPSPEQ